MNKFIKSRTVSSLKSGLTVRFKTNLFGKERIVVGKYIDFFADYDNWLIYLEDYTVEGVQIDSTCNEKQAFPDRKSTRLNSSHIATSRMPSSA